MERRAAVVMAQTQRLPGEMGEQIRPDRDALLETKDDPFEGGAP